MREIGARLGVSADYLALGRETSEEQDPLFRAELAARLGDPTAAKAAYVKVIESGRPVEAVARAQTGLGFLAFEAGDHEQAITHFEQALADVQEGAETAFAADRLGRAYALTGRFDQALALLSRYRDDAQKRDDPLDSVRFTVLLANTHIDRCDYATAEKLLSEILDQALRSLEPSGRAAVYWAQSRLHSSQNKPALASRYARQALATLEQTEHTGYVANALLLLATLENDQGNSADAESLLEQAAPVVRAAGNRYDIGRLELEQARSSLGLGRRDEASSRALGSIPLLAAASPTNVARGYAIAAGIFKEIGDTAKATELYELAAESFPAQDRHAAETYNALAELAEEHGDKDAALRYLRLALNSNQPLRT